VLVGFGPSFYFNGYLGERLGSPPLRSLSAMIVVHGFVFSAWMIVLIAQARFVAHGYAELDHNKVYDIAITYAAGAA
jgi:hypothetical protein